MVVWSELPNDLLYLIGKKLDIVADRFRFRSVCKSWRCSLPPFAQPPCFMLSESQLELLESSENSKRDKEEKKVKPIPPPPPPHHQMRCVGSTGTWLITVDKSSMIHLLNPFTSAQIDLPSQSTFEFGFEYGSEDDDDNCFTPENHRDGLLRKTIISSSPSSSSSSSKVCLVMVIHHYHKKMAIARPGDASWTTVETRIDYVEDIIFFKNQFYTVNLHGGVMVCDIGDDIHSPKASVLTERLPKTSIQEQKYLVELLGELLLVIKFVLDLDDNEDGEEEIKLPAYKPEKFDVYKLDFANKKWEEVNSLGEYCLFLGFDTSVSVRAVNYSGFLKKN